MLLPDAHAVHAPKPGATLYVSAAQGWQPSEVPDEPAGHLHSEMILAPPGGRIQRMFVGEKQTIQIDV